MEETLARMKELLESDGINYSIFLRLYSCAASQAGGVDAVLKSLIGADAVIEKVRELAIGDMLEELEGCIGYVGDEGDGPGPVTLTTPVYAALYSEIVAALTDLHARSETVKTFRFRSGHPGYPVFWSFAFLFLGADRHYLIVGSSSD